MLRFAIRSCGGLISRLAYARAKQEGVNTHDLLKRAGLDVADIKDPDARLSAVGQIKFIELVARAVADRRLGFHLAKDFDLRQLEFLYYVPLSAKSLGAGLQRLERYSSLANESIVLRVKKGRVVRVQIQYTGVARHTDHHQVEFWITAAIRLCRHLTSRDLKPVTVRLAHHRGFAANDLDKLAGVTIDVGAGIDEVAFAGGSWDLPVAHPDPYLHNVLVRFCENALSRREKKGSPLRVRVENAAADLLPHGHAQSNIVAATLGMSSRTLARRLSDEGLSFSEIVRDLRTALAQRYLADRELPISQVAWLLGYKEVAAFTHAFRRWTGLTPSAARKQRRGK